MDGMGSYGQAGGGGVDGMLLNVKCHGKGWRLILIKGSSSMVTPTKSTYVWQWHTQT